MLKAISLWSVAHSGNDALRLLVSKVGEKSEGVLIINFIGGPEVIPGFDQPEALLRVTLI